MTSGAYIPLMIETNRKVHLSRANRDQYNLRKPREEKGRAAHCSEVSPARLVTSRRRHRLCNRRLDLQTIKIATHNVEKSCWASINCRVTWMTLVTTMRNDNIDFFIHYGGAATTSSAVYSSPHWFRGIYPGHYRAGGDHDEEGTLPTLATYQR